MNAKHVTLLLFLLPLLSCVLSVEMNYTLGECTSKSKTPPPTHLQSEATSGYVTGVTISGNTMECTWIIQADNLRTFSLYSDEILFDCDKSDITIFNTRDNSNQSLCNLPGKNNFLGHSVVFYVKANISKEDIVKSKVQFRFYACGGTVDIKRGNKGTIEAPMATEAYPYESSLCVWKLKTTSMSNVIVMKEQMNIETDVDCSRDIVQISSGDRSITFCKETDLTKNVTISGATIYITFKINGTRKAKRHFRFQYFDCYSKVSISGSEKNVSITSVGYPDAAPPSSKCRWEITTEVGFGLYFLFKNTILNNTSTSCNETHLKLLYTRQPVLCRTQTGSVTWYRDGNFAILEFKTGDSYNEAKFEVLVSPLNMSLTENINLRGSNVTTTYIEMPKFPGPFPLGQKFRWYISNRYISVYLEYFNTSEPCADVSLAMTFYPEYKKMTVCSGTPSGYLHSGTFMVMDFKQMSASTTDFRLLIDHTDGKWTGWQRKTDCSVKCGKGHIVLHKYCSDPPPTVKDKGCFLNDGRTRAMIQTLHYPCEKLCRMTSEEKTYSVFFELEFSEAISDSQFNTIIGPVIKSLLARSLNLYCNKNAEQCCPGSSSEKRNTAITYNFIGVDGIHFTTDTPTIYNNKVKVSVYAVSKTDNKLCSSGKTNVRRKRSASTPSHITAALSNTVLWTAMKQINISEIVSVVTAALRSAGLNFTVIVSTNPQKVQQPQPPTPKPTSEPGTNYFLAVGLPIGIVVFVCVIVFLVFVYVKQKHNSDVETGTVVYTKTS